MRRTLLLACGLVGLITSGLSAFVIYKDYHEAIRIAGERTSSFSRMITAWGDVSADTADQILAGAIPLVADWDLKDQNKAREIHERLRQLASRSVVVSAAAVNDANGIVLVNSRAFPAEPVSVADRPYFKAHQGNVADPLILGDEEVGPISGRKRFTFSRALRNPDGSLKAVVVAAIYTSSLDILFKEAANWRGAQAGLYGLGGDVLAQMEESSQSAPRFLAAVEGRMAQTPDGTAVLSIDGDSRVVAWSSSGRNPRLYSLSSQSLGAALREWKARAITIVLLVMLANFFFWAFAYFASKSALAQQIARANDLAVRETHHRLKNSLQMISSLINMRAARFDDPELSLVVRDITNDLRAVAEVHSMVQGNGPLGILDISKTIGALCSQLKETYKAQITYQPDGPILVDAKHATAISVIFNELVTNAVKHGGPEVKVTCHEKDGTLFMSVRDNGVGLPQDFSVDAIGSFGLRAVKAMLSGLGGSLIARNEVKGGSEFLVTIPLAGLR